MNFWSQFIAPKEDDAIVLENSGFCMRIGTINTGDDTTEFRSLVRKGTIYNLRIVKFR